MDILILVFYVCGIDVLRRIPNHWNTTISPRANSQLISGNQTRNPENQRQVLEPEHLAVPFINNIFYFSVMMTMIFKTLFFFT